MGLFDRFKSNTAPTQKASAARVKKGAASTQQGLTAKEWLDKGLGLGKLGRYQEALDYLDKALAIDPSNVNAWNGKAAVLGTLGRYQEALDYLDKALAIDPNDAYAQEWKQEWKQDMEVLGSGVPDVQKMRENRDIERLVKALRYEKDYKVRLSAAEALNYLKWTPGEDEIGAYYWAAKEHYDLCVAIGLPSIKPLEIAFRDETTPKLSRFYAGQAIQKLAAKYGLQNPK